MQFNKIQELDIKNKILFIRSDMNVPLHNGKISDATRIDAGLVTIKYALDHGAKVILATHLGRPTEGVVGENDGVQIIADYIGEKLSITVPVIKNFTNGITWGKSKLLMLENVRCNIGEKDNSEALGKLYASLCDIFVHDAFATAHRAESSTYAVAEFAKIVCAGILMNAELEALTYAIKEPKHPVVAIVAGSKVSTKLSILSNLADKVDYLIVGGGILNTFLLANGEKIGKSLVEVDLLDESRKIMQKMQSRGAVIPLPEDVVVASEFNPLAHATEKSIDNILETEMILDIGHKFALQLDAIIHKAGTIIWNGPMGVFEFDQFANGTHMVANAIANSDAYSLAGGGDTVAAINKFKLFNKISYVSTAGGALLEFLEGKPLPAIEILCAKYKKGL